MGREIRLAVRHWMHRPGVAIAAVLTAALGIGAIAAAFGVVQAVLLQPLPFEAPDRLVALWESNARIPRQEVSVADFHDWRARATAFDGMAAFTMAGHARATIAGRAGAARGASPPNGTPRGETDMPAETVKAALASHDLFEVLGVRARLGRTFVREDEQPGRDRIVLLAHDLWRRRFQADPAIVGRVLTIDGEPATVIGVMPRFQAAPAWADVWMPLSRIERVAAENRAFHVLQVIGRLRDGLDERQAEQELRLIAARLAAEFPRTNGATGAFARSLHADTIGDARLIVLALFVTVALVLLIACVNIANLMLAQQVVRQRELAVRLALGAGRAGLARQFLAEGLTLSCAGGLLSLLVAHAALAALRLFAADALPRAHTMGIDAGTLAFAAAITIITGLFFGTVPMMQVSRTDMQQHLRSGRGADAPGLRRWQSGLTMGEVALALMVVVMTGLLGRSFSTILAADAASAGVRGSGEVGEVGEVATLRVSLPQRYASPDQARAFHAALLSRAQQLPGVAAAGTVSVAPLARQAQRHWIDKASDPADGRFPVAQWRLVSPRYLDALGARLLDGRAFTDADLGARRVLVNEAFVRAHIAEGSAVGRHVVVGPGLVSGQGQGQAQGQSASRARFLLPIVGVVSNTRELGLDVDPEPTVYLCDTPREATLVLRGAADAGRTLAALQRLVAQAAPDAAMYDARTLRGITWDALARRRVALMAFVLLASVAVLLAGLGIYSVTSHAVARRRREMGIRMTLGADPRRLVAMVLCQAGGVAACGIAGGLLLALLASGWIRGMLFHVQPDDPVAFVAAAAAVLFIALLAAFLPARRAARIAPSVSMAAD